MNLWLALLLFAIAAILGNTANYFIGYLLGPAVFQKRSRWFKQEYLTRAHAFYGKYGAQTIIFGRFIPIIRTFVPFVAGIGKMEWRKFLLYNTFGGLAWVLLLTLGGYFFGSVALVQQHFGLVVVGIIVVSLIPAGYELARHLIKPRP